MKLMQNNLFVKPLAVLTSSAPALTYLGFESQDLFMTSELTYTEEMVAVSTELIQSFQGSLILLVLLISIMNVYKPNKAIVFSILIGGLALVASALLEVIGMTLLIYGLSVVFNSFVLNPVIMRNDALAGKIVENEVDRLIKEARK